MHGECGARPYSGNWVCYATSFWQLNQLIPQLGSIPLVISHVHFYCI